MKFTLITVTMGDRSDALLRLDASLQAQHYRDFEWIVVDHRKHPEFCGSLSKARNYGLSIADGDIIAFPDDDAWYDESVLSDVIKVLALEGLDGVSFRVVDDNGVCSAGWMSSIRKKVTKKTIWHTVVSCSLFLKRSCIGEVRFDERLGVGSGTRFGSGEETDFVLSVLENGANIMYDGTKSVFHPRVTSTAGMSKGWRYGNGYGYVLRKHHYSFMRLIWGAGIQFVRMMQAALYLDFKRIGFHFGMMAGRICGYFSCR